MRIYLKYIPAIYHPDPIRNDGALGIFEDSRPNNKKKNNNNNNLVLEWYRPLRAQERERI